MLFCKYYFFLCIIIKICLEELNGLNEIVLIININQIVRSVGEGSGMSKDALNVVLGGEGSIMSKGALNVELGDVRRGMSGNGLSWGAAAALPPYQQIIL